MVINKKSEFLTYYNNNLNVSSKKNHSLPLIPQISPTLNSNFIPNQKLILLQPKTAPGKRKFPIFVALERGLNESR